jgi:Thioredoxin like C-terminal domain
MSHRRNRPARHRPTVCDREHPEPQLFSAEVRAAAELHGHVVLVNFWTLTCINWLRQEPYVRAWPQAHRADGLIVIGVHTPEFSFEHEIERIRPAITEREIDYPVAVDNHYKLIRQHDMVREQTLEITFLEAGAEAYVFTFG